MRSQVKLCKIEGCNNPSWSGGMCKNHTPKKPMKQSREKLYFPKTEEDSFKPNAVHDLFLKIWKERPHKSEISGMYLGKEPLSIYFHHILPKSKYPELSLIEENIIILSLDEHTNVENDIYKYEEINKRREYLKKKYEL